MAPNFLSKFTKAASPAQTTTRERSESNTQRSSFSLPRSRAPSVTSPSRADVRSSESSIGAKGSQQQQPQIAVPTIIKTDINRSNDTLDPNVTVVPPSPLVYTASLASESDYDDRYHPNTNNSAAPNQITSNGASAQPKSISGTGDYSAPNPRTTSTSAPLVPAATTTASPSPISIEDVVTPTTAKPVSVQRAVTPSSSSTNLREAAAAKAESTMPSKTLAPSSGQVRKQSSNRSLNAPAPITTRSATAPANAFSAVVVDANGAVTMTPIVESPTALRAPEFPSIKPGGDTTNGNTSTLTVNRDNSDSASIISSKGEKKRPWKRSTTKKPTGLAGAIAASGLVMANPSMNYVQMSPPPIMSPLPTSTSRKSSNPGSPPYMSRSPASSSKHVKSRSADMSPGGKRGGGGKGKGGKTGNGTGTGGVRRTSVSVNSDAASEYVGGEGGPEYYSGLESSSEDGSGSDDLDDLDLGEDDIPVTGFAVASNKRNADFHDLFSNIPEGDYLIEDYGCALQREILIQGRIYISENHICFHANIFGWITNLSIPIYEIVSLEKKMTAFVIPNAIQITTRQSKYTFASFLSRDTTFDVIFNIWRLARPDDNGSIRSSGRGSLDGPVSSSPALPLAAGPAAAVMAKSGGPAAHKVTTCACSKDGGHYSETMMESIFPGTPDRIHNLMFASGFIKDFLAVDQKLLDLQMSDWTPVSEGSKLLTKNMSYIKPLNGSLGPKQTKCEIKDEMLHVDFDQYVTTLTTTRTPDVPSGGVFSVKTRTCITWASAVSTKVLVTTAVEWTGRSFIKGIIERSAIDGQRTYHGDLEKAMRAYIQEHQSEFIPEGVDPDIALATVVAPTVIVDTTAAAHKGTEPLTEEERKQREHERNQRGLQWAWDTFDGAYQVAKRSTKGALELVSDAWEQSTSTTILYFVIVVLVFSNLYTLMRMGGREEVGRRKEMRKVEEREKWVQSIVTALWDELAAGKKEAIGMVHHGRVNGGDGSSSQSPADTVAPGSWMEEVAHLHDTLNTVEQRVKAIRETLVGFEQLNVID